MEYNNEIMVSICCLVYNHEKYLRKCLDGFVMQKTNFKFEILIHDDASTDGSKDIIHEYEVKYHDIIKPIYQSENQYSKGVKVSWEFQYPRAQGKYIAMCEGDDYWTDEYKLQKQFDKMEKHPECSLCAHKVRRVTEGGELQEYCYPNTNEDNKYMSSDVFIRRLITERYYQYQTSSYFFRTKYIKMVLDDKPEFISVAPVGDAPMMLYLGTRGNVLYICDEMSHYRCMSHGSYSSRVNKQVEKYKKVVNGYSDMYRAFDMYTGYVYQKEINHTCLRNDFLILQLENNYRLMIKSEYKSILKELTNKEQINIKLSAKFPKIMQIYRRIRKCMRGFLKK